MNIYFITVENVMELLGFFCNQSSCKCILNDYTALKYTYSAFFRIHLILDNRGFNHLCSQHSRKIERFIIIINNTSSVIKFQGNKYFLETSKVTG
jgi:hypothetical protein